MNREQVREWAERNVFNTGRPSTEDELVEILLEFQRDLGQPASTCVVCDGTGTRSIDCFDGPRWEPCGACR